jgi:hypothetical protein
MAAVQNSWELALGCAEDTKVRSPPLFFFLSLSYHSSLKNACTTVTVNQKRIWPPYVRCSPANSTKQSLWLFALFSKPHHYHYICETGDLS